MSRMLYNEGADITGADMDLPQIESELIQFYTNKTIFLTGATGFIGQLFLEKLLRTCPNLRKVIILLRSKNGRNLTERFKQLIAGACFEPLQRKNPNFIKKIHIIEGDISQPNMGINVEDTKMLITEVECVIHCAAIVQIDEKLRKLAYSNVRSVSDLIAIAKQMKKLQAMVYVSTAYSNCIQNEINEVFYEPIMTGSQLLNFVECLNDETLDKITPSLIGSFPNPYVFTKSIAENVIKTEAKSLPISICRPSTIVSTLKEPLAGWINNINGITGMVLDVSLGLLHAIHARKEYPAEIVPADFVVNCSLAALWKNAQNSNTEQLKENKDPLIYNYVSSVESPISWNLFMKISERHGANVPSPLMVWYPFLFMISSKFFYRLAIFVFHTIPGYVGDFGAKFLGKQPMLLKEYQKIEKILDIIGFFTYRKWTFKNNNVQKLWDELNEQDKQLFEFSMKNFDWDSFCFTYFRGARIYLLKDPLDTIPQGEKQFFKLKIAHFSLCTVLLYLFYKLVTWLFYYLFF